MTQNKSLRKQRHLEKQKAPPKKGLLGSLFGYFKHSELDEIEMSQGKVKKNILVEKSKLIQKISEPQGSLLSQPNLDFDELKMQFNEPVFEPNKLIQEPKLDFIPLQQAETPKEELEQEPANPNSLNLHNISDHSNGEESSDEEEEEEAEDDIMQQLKKNLDAVNDN